MLLHHAFELVLKAAILHRGCRIHDKASRYTFGFDKFLAVAEEGLRLITKDEPATLLDLPGVLPGFARYVDSDPRLGFREMAAAVPILGEVAAVALDVTDRTGWRVVAGAGVDAVIVPGPRPRSGVCSGLPCRQAGRRRCTNPPRHHVGYIAPV